MPSARDEDDFFVGYLATPKPVLRFLRRAVPAMFLIVLVAAVVMAARQRDPGNGEWDDQIRQLEGTLLTRPYPILQSHDGRSFLLVGEGKHALELPAGAVHGATIRAQGTIIQRGRLRLLETLSLAVLAPPQTTAKMPEIIGESRSFRGEIVDPKCFAGGMKPGEGKTHKACAALCIRGGIPPALVSDEGEIFVITGLSLDQVVPFVGEMVEVRGVASDVGGIPFLRVTQPPRATSK